MHDPQPGMVSSSDWEKKYVESGSAAVTLLAMTLMTADLDEDLDAEPLALIHILEALSAHGH